MLWLTALGSDCCGLWACTARPADLVERQFTAERHNQLRAADFTYVATWKCYAFVAFVVTVIPEAVRATSPSHVVPDPTAVSSRSSQ